MNELFELPDERLFVSGFLSAFPDQNAIWNVKRASWSKVGPQETPARSALFAGDVLYFEFNNSVILTNQSGKWLPLSSSATFETGLSDWILSVCFTDQNTTSPVPAVLSTIGWWRKSILLGGLFNKIPDVGLLSPPLLENVAQFDLVTRNWKGVTGNVGTSLKESTYCLANHKTPVYPGGNCNGVCSCIADLPQGEMPDHYCCVEAGMFYSCLSPLGGTATLILSNSKSDAFIVYGKWKSSLFKSPVLNLNGKITQLAGEVFPLYRGFPTDFSQGPEVVGAVLVQEEKFQMFDFATNTLSEPIVSPNQNITGYCMLDVENSILWAQVNQGSDIVVMDMNMPGVWASSPFSKLFRSNSGGGGDFKMFLSNTDFSDAKKPPVC
jgi:hypothetical protein